MAHTGLFVAPVAGTPPVGMSPTDGRLVMGAIFQVASQLVAGGGYTASASVMQATVNQAVWSLTDVTNGSAVFFSPTDQITLTFSAAPATGGRIDLVVVKQNNIENGDADSRVNVSVVTGTASGSPVAPSVPAGAAKYLQVLINAGVTNMAAATWTNYMQSQYAQPQLQASTLSGLNSVTGVMSQLAIVTSDSTAWKNGVYVWTGSWVQIAGTGRTSFTPSWTNLNLGSGGTATGYYTVLANWVQGYVKITLGTGFSISSDPKFTAPVTMGFPSDPAALGTGQMVRTGTGYYSAMTVCDGSGNVALKALGGASFLAGITSTAPASWAAGDVFTLNFAYPI